jgi:hypothetical protein
MRLVTRGDLDGLASAVIITSKEKIDSILLIHPQDITDKRHEIRSDDILANLPYHRACAKWFDHHLLTQSNEKPPEGFQGKWGLAPSAAQLVWEYYGCDPRFEKLIRETNRLDAAQLTREDVLDPKDYILFGYTIDGRSGLGAYQSYFEKCIDWVKTMSIGQVLEQPEVAERVDRLREEDAAFRQALQNCSKLDRNVVFTDFRPHDRPPVGNRFLVYTLFPESNVSLRVHWGPQKKFVVAAVGHSIFNRTCRTNVGELMSRYGGGGHRGAGTTPLRPEAAERQIGEIIEELLRNG